LVRLVKLVWFRLVLVMLSLLYKIHYNHVN